MKPHSDVSFSGYLPTKRHRSVMNSETGIEGGGGIAILGNIHNSTVPEHPT